MIGIAAGVAVAVAMVPLVAYLAPRVLPNLFTSVAETAEPQTVSDGGASATVTVPAGWASQRSWGSESELILRSPDGRFVATLIVSAGTPSDTVAADPEVEGAEVVLERLGSGLDAAHAQSDTALVVAVGGTEAAAGAGVSLRLEAQGTPDELAPYRPALAGLLESMRVSS